MRIIRKELAAAQLYPDNLRYDSATDTVQYSPDGGTTWIDSPQSDPRNAQTLAPRPGVASPCDNAAAIIAVLQQLETAIVAQLTAGTGALALGTGIVAIIALFVPYISLLYLLISTFATSLVALGAGAIDAAFTPTVWHDLECLIFDFLESGVPVSDTSLGLLEAQVTAQFDVVVAAVINGVLELMGGGGVNTIMSAASADAGCSDCQACAGTYDLAFAPYGGGLAQFSHGQTFSAFGEWVAGTGWQAVASGGWGNLTLRFYCPAQTQGSTWQIVSYHPQAHTFAWQLLDANTGHIWQQIYSNYEGAGTRTITAVKNLGGVYDTIFQVGWHDNSNGICRAYQLTVTPH